MKIGIITYHHGLNHGSFLQSYAMKKLFSNEQNDAEIINYANKSHVYNNIIAYFKTKNPMLFVRSVMKYINFERENKILHLKKRIYTQTKIIKYDKIVYGSDTLWNWSSKILGEDPIYYGDIGYSNLNTPLFAFAVSCGDTSGELTLPNELSKKLRRFKNIYVRDQNTQKFTNTNINFKPEIVLDPTLLVDMTELITEIKDEDFILVYAYMIDEKYITKIKEFSKKINKKIISIGYHNKWADVNKTSIGPGDWLAYFSKAKIIFTGTFHGTMFSIKFNKPFILIDNQYINLKTLGVLNAIGINENKIEDINLSADIINLIDYEKVNVKLNALIIQSKNKIEQILLS